MTHYEKLKNRINKFVTSTKEWENGNSIKLIKGESAGGIYIIGVNCILGSMPGSIELNDGYDYEFSDFELIGKEITLSDVLLWHSAEGRDSSSRFEVFEGKAMFLLYDVEEYRSVCYFETKRIDWDLSKPYLKDQSNELIEWLSSI